MDLEQSVTVRKQAADVDIIELSQLQPIDRNELAVEPKLLVDDAAKAAADFAKRELFVISFIRDKMTLPVPTARIMSVGMCKLAEPPNASSTRPRSIDCFARAAIARLAASPQEVSQNNKNGDDTENNDEAIRRERRPRIRHVTCRQGHYGGNQITKNGHRIHCRLLMSTPARHSWP